MEEPPIPDADATGAKRALEQAAMTWSRAGHARALPIGLQETILDQLRTCMHGSASQGAAVIALPPHWPPRGHAWAALDALAALEFHVLRHLAGSASRPAGRDPLACVHETFVRVREALARTMAGQSEADAPALQRALEKRDRQLSIATHELRTPLSSILLNLQMLERAARADQPVDSASLLRLLAIPMRQLRRLRHMIDMLLDVAQVESDRIVLQLEPVDLCELVHDAVERLAALARERSCAVQAHHCEPVIGRWDRARLEQVVTNLLTNAVKYGGGAARVAASSDGRQAMLVVEDTGAGIAAADRTRIFEPYERLAATRGEDGAGLGLYIVREIVRAHGGTIEVAPREGGGTVFTVRLPMQQGRVDDITEEAGRHETPSREPRHGAAG